MPLAPPMNTLAAGGLSGTRGRPHGAVQIAVAFVPYAVRYPRVTSSPETSALRSAPLALFTTCTASICDALGTASPLR